MTFYSVMLGYYLSQACFFLKDTREADLGGMKGEEELGGSRGDCSHYTLYEEKSIYYQHKGKRKKITLINYIK